MAKNSFGDEIVASPSTNSFGDPIVQASSETAQGRGRGGSPSKPDNSIPYVTDIGRALMSEATGIRDVAIDGPAQLLTHLLPDGVVEKGAEFNNWLRSKGVPLAEMPERNLASQVTGDKNITLDKYEHEREAGIQMDRGANGESGIDGFRGLGNVMSPTNFVLPGSATSALGKIGLAGVQGAVAGMMNPVTEGDFVKGKEAQAEDGAMFGVAGAAGGKILQGAIAPKVRDAARLLLDHGVSLTPGQIIGGKGKQVEEAAKSIPIVGTMIRSGETNALQGFNRATIDKALEPISEQVPKSVAPGREAIEAGQDILSKAYNKLLPKLKFGMDQEFGNDIKDIRQTVSEMPPPQAQQFEAILTNRLGKRAEPGGVMDGKTLKQVQSELSNLSGQYRSSSDAAQRSLGQALDDVNGAIRDALERQNPDLAPKLKNINAAYAAFARVENAASRRPTSGGLFTPGDLLQAIKAGDKSVRKRAFARGDGLMQDWAEGAHQVLGNRLPDSGTAERLMTGEGIAGAGAAAGAALHNPLVAAGPVLAGLAYSRPGMAALRHYATPSPARKELAEALSPGLPSFAPALSAGIAGLATEPSNN